LKSLSQSAFGGSGSFGNGAVMRVAPLGAWFHDDLERVVEQADRSAAVTHAHPEGRTGAIAVAVAAAVAVRKRNQDWQEAANDLLAEVLRHTPAGETRDGILRSRELPAACSSAEAAKALGNGMRVSAPDTVPFVIWSACRHLYNFKRAFEETVVVGGDVDTTAAMVGGIVAAYGGRTCVPQAWLACMEPWPESLRDLA